MMPTPGPATRAITLPGNIKAWYTAPIYAQVSGYVHKWYVDYGAFVKAGTVLATIDAPTVDEQYQTAAANLAGGENQQHAGRRDGAALEVAGGHGSRRRSRRWT